jgi:tRNA modification GTPase
MLTPRMATLLPLHQADGSVLDQGLALWFEAPHSYTGEDVLELQVHGGPVLLQMLLQRCLQAGQALGLRLAEPGEFTQRAFLNGKLDLAQAEAVADLIEAGTESAARSAGRSLSGEFSEAIHGLAERLVKLRLLVEATLDFPEEEIDFLEQADAKGQLAAARDALAELRGKARQGRLLRDGLQVVLAGQPNVGKSSLLNALAGAELAIVTPIAGTTRDKVSSSIQIEGVPVHVTDTAGLRDATDDAIERIGIERTWAAIDEADAVLFLHDLTRRDDAQARDADAAIARALAQRAPRHLLHLHNKADLAPEAAARIGGDDLAISAATGDGLAELRRWLLASAGWSAAPDGVFTARQRHLDALARSAEHLDAAATQIGGAAPALELFAEELRLAHLALGEIVGEFTTEDLLGAIFSRFCIGK